VLRRGVGDHRAMTLAAHDATQALRGHEPGVASGASGVRATGSSRTV
jgi:hypothetical protein